MSGSKKLPAGAQGKILTPGDIEQKEFRVSRFSGYRMRDVDEFLDEVTDSFSVLSAEVERLRSTAGSPPIVGAPDLDEVARQADEIISRARQEASRIVAEAGSQTISTGDRAAVSAFLAHEREFLQGIAGLVQSHAETVKGMARAARNPVTAPGVASAKVPTPTGESPGAVEGGEPSTGASPEQTVRVPKAEAPVRVDEPSPAVVGGGEKEERSGDEEGSLRELFWGED